MPPFDTPRVPPNVRVPDAVMGPPVKVRPVDPPEALTEVTRPRDEVEMDETTPLVPKRRPLSDEANVVVPETFNLPVAVRFVEVALPVTRALPETVRVEPGVVVPMPTLPRKTLFRLDEAAKKFEAAD